MLGRRIEAVLPACVENGVTIVTNMGAANPRAAAAAVVDIARRMDCRGLAVATVVGDDVLELIRDGDFVIAESGRPVRELGDRLVSANAYIGAEAIVAALAQDADIVITGRAADPSLFVAPLAFEFGWSAEDWPGARPGHARRPSSRVRGAGDGRLFRRSRMQGRLPGSRVWGFRSPMSRLQGPIVITKVAGSGGLVTAATCKEQLLYEIHDPAAYVTPDTVADFSQVRVTQMAEDRVAVDGATGRPRPALLKVSLGYRDGYIGEGQISYAGAGAVARGRLAASIVAERLRLTGAPVESVRCDLIGVDSLHGPRLSAGHEPYEVRLRVTARADSLEAARRIGQEVETLYTNGPAGGGGAVAATRDILAVVTTFVPRELVSVSTHVEVVA